MSNPLSATARAERSREATKAAAARELLYGGTLARIWPAYTTNVRRPNPEYPYLLCVESPAGLLTWRLSEDEAVFFEWLPNRQNTGELAADRTPILMALAESPK